MTITAAATSHRVVPIAVDAADASSPSAPAIAIGAEGGNGQLYVQAPQLASGWQPLGGQITGAPAVAAAPGSGATSPASPVFIATGTNGELWMRTLTLGWQAIGPSEAFCIGSPAAVLGSGGTLTVACEGLNRQLYYNTTTMPSSGLPTFTNAWTSLGGILSAGPAVAPVGGTLTYFAEGTNGQVFTNTGAGFTATPWFCIGTLAAATDASSGTTTFACQGQGDHSLWKAISAGTGWSTAQSLGGVLLDGPGVAPAGLATEIVAEGTDGSVWEWSATGGWISLGGIVSGGVGAAALTTAGGAPWGDAIEVPGGADFEDVTSVSCPSAGNCTAAGAYTGGEQAFVADEVNGTWGDALQVPGTGIAYVYSVSCASAGNCTAGGDYNTGGNYQGFVADEVNGIWGAAIDLTASAVDSAGGAQVLSVSCPSAGNCTAGGQYYNSSSGYQAFVADEVNGAWDTATEVPGTVGLNAGADAGVSSVSCPSAGNCAAGGWYYDSSHTQQAFVVDEVNGAWDTATEVPGTPDTSIGGGAEVRSVSCSSAGNCVAGGGYVVNSSAGSYNAQAFVASEVNGSWGDATEVPGSAALNIGDYAWVASLSCPSAGNCTAAGSYAAGSPLAIQAFVVSEVNGAWGDAIQVPGTVGPAQAISVSCQSAGNCVAGGDTSAAFAIGAGGAAYVVSEVNGTWGDAIDVSSAALNADGGDIFSVSCPPTGGCGAGGTYYPYGSGFPLAFVVSQN